MPTEQETTATKSNWLGIGALMAAIGASACCVGPFLLLSLGVGGAWMSSLTSMEATRPIFMGLALLFIALGFRKLYLVPDCCKDDACALPDVKRRQRVIFWIGSIAILLLLAFPWYVGFFME